MSRAVKRLAPSRNEECLLLETLLRANEVGAFCTGQIDVDMTYSKTAFTALRRLLSPPPIASELVHILTLSLTTDYLLGILIIVINLTIKADILVVI